MISGYMYVRNLKQNQEFQSWKAHKEYKFKIVKRKQIY